MIPGFSTICSIPLAHGWYFVQLRAALNKVLRIKLPLPTNHAPWPSPYALCNVGPTRVTR